MLGIEDVRANVTPQGKHDCVRALQAGGAVVAMVVGDGVNDAPVLAQAQGVGRHGRRRPTGAHPG